MTDEPFQLFFEAAPHPYLVLRPDDDFTIVAVNGRYLDATGTKRSDLVGRGLFEVFPDNPDDRITTSVSDLRSSLGRVKSEGVVDVMGVQRYDIPTAGTADEFEERYWSPVNTPVFDSGGKLAFIIHHVEDVTEFVLSRVQVGGNVDDAVKAGIERTEAGVLQRAREVKEANRQIKSAMEQSSARLASVVESAMDAIISTDADHRIILFNAAAERMFQYKAEDMIGRSLDLLLPERFRTAHRGYIEAFAKTGISNRAMGQLGTLSALRADGTEFPIEASISQSHVGGTQLFTVILRDISGRKRSELALHKAQRMDALGQLTGGIAHDFNNLLTIIMGAHELALETTLDDDARSLIDRAYQAAEMGARLTKRLLSFARQQKLEPAFIDLNEQILNMTDLLRRSLGETIAISANLGRDLWTVCVDPGEIENAVLNLAINARDAMPHGGRLIMETRNIGLEDGDSLAEYELQRGDYVCLTVSDTGTGMPPEVAARAFEPFFTTKAGRGTGLGLASIYGFVKQSGGNVTIYSEPDRGTTVRLYLPKAAARSVRAGSDLTGSTPTATGETVLVVEDNPELRALSIDRLRRLGYQVVEADSGLAALSLLEKPEKIDLIFSDVVMPGGMSGYELARLVTQRHPGIKILLTSGYDAELAAEQDSSDVDLRVLSKPYKQAELARALREALKS